MPPFATNRRAVHFSRVLIEGGSSINILYKDTMEKLGIKQRQLQNNRTMFHGIVLVQDIDAAAPVYQNSREASSSSICGKGGIQDQGIGARTRHHLWVVSPAPADGLLGPVHELWRL